VRRLYRASRRGAEGDRCDLCAEPLASDHEHLFAPRERALACVCAGCALIQIARYRRVPKRFTPVAIDSRALLAMLGVPVGVAAILVHEDGRKVVTYPGPAGLVEAALDEELADMPPLEPEVEALVCSSLAGGGAWIAGIDIVFELIGELRRHWRGLTGGAEAPAAIARVLATHGAR